MKIAILSRNESLYSTGRLLEAGRERGHDVDVVDYLKCYTINEANQTVVYHQGEEMSHLDAIIPRISTLRTFYGSAIVRQFELQKVFSINSSQSIARSRDKLRSLQILSREGIGMPRTAFASSPSDIDNLIRQIGGPPLVIKLLEGTQGKGVVLAETMSAARSVLDAFYNLKANIIIQEYIKEAKGEDIRIFVVGNKVVGAMKRVGKKDDFRSNLHRGGIAERVAKLPKSEKQTALIAARAMGLKVAGVDIIRSERGPLVMEVNSSPGLEGIEKATGKDVAGELIKYIEEKAGRSSTKDKIGH